MPRAIGKTMVALTLSCLLSSTGTRASDLTAPGRGGNDVSACIDVTVNDHPVIAYDCLNQRLASPVAGNKAAPGFDASDVSRLPSNQQVGQFNLSSFSHRMGANLGKSVVPQRPTALPGPTSPLLPAPAPGR